MAKKLKPLGNYLLTGSKLATLRSQMQQQKTLLQQVKGLLPPPLRNHCLNVIIKGQELVLHTDSSAWASKLR